MKKSTLISSILLVASSLFLVGCSQPQSSGGTENETTPVVQEQSNQGKPLKIVTTFPPLYSHTANIIDENDTLTNLVPPGTSVHTWQPKPSDLLAMESADVIITNGLGLEEFLEKYLETLEEKGVRIVDTSEGITPLEFGKEDEHHDDHEDEHEDEHHHHEGPDPHIWLDTDNAIIQVENITNALLALDSEQEIFYTEQASIYTENLKIVDQNIISRKENTEIQPFIVFHDAYQYFLQAYDLDSKQVGLVQEFHGDNPSQKDIAELLKTITIHSVSTLYTEPQFNPSVVQRLKQETGVSTQEIDPIGDELSKEGYVNTMLNLAKAFVKK